LLRFILGAVLGATAVMFANPKVADRARPLAKSGLKSAMKALYAARVSGAEAYEAAEDLFAEAKNEVAMEIFAEAMTATQAGEAEAAKDDKQPRADHPGDAAAEVKAQAKPSAGRSRRTKAKREAEPPAGHA
jgi:gas vesicle protein